MLKHYEIINRMSDSEKIHLLCDIRNLSEERYRAAGIPEVNFASVDDFCENEYPSPFALANTWDLSLIRKTADALVEKSMANGVDLLRMPNPKIKLNPFRRALSEDPFLAAKISGEYLDAADHVKMATCLGEFGLHKDELEFVDDEPDERLIQECIEKNYRMAIEGKSCKAFLGLEDLSGTAYENVNSRLSQKASDDFRVLTVCQKVGTENTVPYIENGRMFFKGAPLVAETALSRYKTLKNNIRQGSQTEEDLAQEMENNKVLSKEKLDAAMDCLLDFIFSLANEKKYGDVTPNESLMREAAQKSVVLLKNNENRLPLKKVTKIALIGDIAFGSEENENSLIRKCNRELTDLGYQIIGMDRGYEMNQFRSNLSDSTFTLAQEADVVILFLGLGEKRIEKACRAKKISLPANQMALLDCLKEYKNKIVAVMPSEAPADIGVAENCEAILLVPFQTKYSANVLAETLNGTLNPSGKLSSTVYLDSDALYSQYVSYRKRDGLKQGTFVGYRYYDIAQEKIAFPFGHGLGYTSFVYSKFSVKENIAYVTVKNVGKTAGDEIVQLYAGMEKSSVLRPLKELCGFARVSLKPGEKQNLQIPIVLPEVYVEEQREYVAEEGEYTFYVGASVADIRLSCRQWRNETPLAPDQKNLSDYIHTKSNIQQDNYKLEAKIKTMKRSMFNLVAGISAIVMAVILRLYCFSMSVNYDFFTWFQLFLAVFGVIFFIKEAVHRNALRRREDELLEEKNEEIFEEAEQISKYEADAMFMKIFEGELEQNHENVEEHVGIDETESLDFVNKNQTFEVAAREFETFARERGSQFRTEDCRKIFSAMAASRLVMFSGLPNQDFQILMHLLSDYFETSLHIEAEDDSYQTSSNLLFKSELQIYFSSAIKTHVHLAMDEARMNPHNICLAGLKNVTGKLLPQYFSPYINYIKNPLSNSTVKVLNELNVEKPYYISPNLWFFMNLSEGESMASIPDFIAENAALLTISRTACEESEIHLPILKFSYYQMDYLTEKTASSYSIPEDMWKRVDRLEELVNRYESFAIGNKLWLSLEKFVYVYLACGGNAAESLDEAVAAKLILPMMILLNGKLSSDDQSFVDTIETVFGEDHTEACKKLIRNYEMHRAQND